MPNKLLMGVGVKVLLPYLLGKGKLVSDMLAGANMQQPAMEITGKDDALINLRNKLGSVVVLLGTRDTGKSELAYRLAEFLGRPTFAVSPQQKPPSWIKWLTLEQIFTEVPRKSTLIMDDLPAYLSNKDYNESLSRAVEKVIPMVRHEPTPPEFPIGEIHLIFASQSAAQADRYILDCDMAFFKPLGLLFEDMERPHIKRIYTQWVEPVFFGQSDKWIQRHAYMWSRTYRGLIAIKKVE